MNAVLKRLNKLASDLFNWLNMVGAAVLAYALLNPTVGTEFVSLLPDDMRKPVAVIVPLLWFVIVQIAKARSVKKTEDAA